MDWITLGIMVVALVAGFGSIKVNPIITAVLGIISSIIIIGVLVSVLFGIGGLLGFFTASTVGAYLVAASGGFLVGSIVGAFV